MTPDSLIDKLEAEILKPVYEGSDFRSGLRTAIAIVRQHESEHGSEEWCGTKESERFIAEIVSRPDNPSEIRDNGSATASVNSHIPATGNGESMGYASSDRVAARSAQAQSGAQQPVGITDEEHLGLLAEDILRMLADHVHNCQTPLRTKLCALIRPYMPTKRELSTQLSDCEQVVRQYRRISSSAGDKAWKEYQEKYTQIEVGSSEYPDDK